MLTPEESRVLGLVDDAATVALASALVAADSSNPGGTEAGTVEVLAAACRDAGLDVDSWEVAPGRPNLVAVSSQHADPNAAGLLFLGHSDVVPAGSGWSRQPFEPEVADGRLYGRGSADMKAGLAAVLAAVDAVRRSGVRLRAPVALACTVDEEDLDLGIRDLTDQPGRLPGRYAGCVVAEPTSLDVIVACRGDAYLEVEVTGVPAHSGRPDDGRNAIDAAARIIDWVRADHARLAGAPDPLLGSATWSVGRISGGQTTSMVAPDAHLWIDRRLLPDETAEGVAGELRRGIEGAGIVGDGIGVSVTATMEMPGFRTPTDSPVVAACSRAASDLDLGSAIGGWTAACDGGFASRDLQVPAVVVGPGSVTDEAHQVDESVSLAEVAAAARLYALLILRIAGSVSEPDNDSRYLDQHGTDQVVSL